MIGRKGVVAARGHRGEYTIGGVMIGVIWEINPSEDAACSHEHRCAGLTQQPPVRAHGLDDEAPWASDNSVLTQPAWHPGHADRPNGGFGLPPPTPSAAGNCLAGTVEYDARNAHCACAPRRGHVRTIGHGNPLAGGRFRSAQQECLAGFHNHCLGAASMAGRPDLAAICGNATS
jgi:hypothetical protein